MILLDSCLEGELSLYVESESMSDARDRKYSSSVSDSNKNDRLFSLMMYLILEVKPKC